VQPISTKQKRSELLQWIISLLTLGLAITESVFHYYLHRPV
jgi:threonine/homoserine efflux transporter RhtA